MRYVCIGEIMKCKLRTFETNHSHCIMQSRGVEYPGMNFVPEMNSRNPAQNYVARMPSQPINNHNVSQPSLDPPILAPAPSTRPVPISSTPPPFPTSVVPPIPPPFPVSKPSAPSKPPTPPSYNNTQTDNSLPTITRDLLKTITLTPPGDIPRKIKKPAGMMITDKKKITMPV